MTREGRKRRELGGARPPRVRICLGSWATYHQGSGLGIPFRVGVQYLLVVNAKALEASGHAGPRRDICHAFGGHHGEDAVEVLRFIPPKHHVYACMEYVSCSRIQLYTFKAMRTTSSSVNICATASSAMSYWLTQNSLYISLEK